MKKFLIIIPAYNEEKSIGRVLSELKAIPSVEREGDILVIDDASSDDTALIARSFGADVVRQVYNMGYGSCLQTGYKYACRKGYEYIIQMDADGQHDAGDVERIYNVLRGTDKITGDDDAEISGHTVESDEAGTNGTAEISGHTEESDEAGTNGTAETSGHTVESDEAGTNGTAEISSHSEEANTIPGSSADIVVGSRFLNGDYSSTSFLKMIAGRLFGFIIKAATGIRVSDPTSGFQGLNRRTFSYYAGYTNFDDKYPDANVLMNMLMHGYRIVEIPVVMFDRREGKSMHSGLKPLGYMFRMVLSLVAVWIENRGVGRK